MTILNNIVAGYGASVVAAVGIANKINQLPIQIVFGFTQGVMPLIGYNYASKNFPRMKESIKEYEQKAEKYGLKDIKKEKVENK